MSNLSAKFGGANGLLYVYIGGMSDLQQSVKFSLQGCSMSRLSNSAFRITFVILTFFRFSIGFLTPNDIRAAMQSQGFRTVVESILA